MEGEERREEAATGEERREGAAEIEQPESPVNPPDTPQEPFADQPRTADGGVPGPGRQEPADSGQEQSVASPQPPAAEYVPEGLPLLVFLSEVAGGRKLLRAVRERVPRVSYVAVVAPQNQPAAGQITESTELAEAARGRVEVTMAVLAEFEIDSVGEVMDPDPTLALDDAIRAHEPGEVLLSALPEMRFGLTRKDLVEWARGRFQPETEITHIPVRIEDDSVRWDVIHTLVVATQTVNTPDLLDRLRERAGERPHRYTIICPRSEQVSREQVSRDLAATLAELYRADVDATGQPMSPDPFHAVQNAVEHYRIDEVLISTFAGEQSRWLEEDLVGRVREITDKPVEHVEAGRPPERIASAVAHGEPARA